MQSWRPDPSFYPSPTLAMQAAPETFAYVAMLDPSRTRPDALIVVDVAPGSASYGRQISQVDMPNAGDELHHFGWNACSSCLCPYAPHAHVERRYLIVPGLRSSRLHVLDTKPNPREPRIVKVIEPETLAARTGYSRPHTVHCGPDGVYLNGLGAPNGDGPGGLFLLDPITFDVKGAWEADRGPQYLAYDFWWHLGHDTLVTSEWGTPNMVENGVIPETLLAGGYGHALHVWDLQTRKHRQVLDLGPEQQMVLELRPAHNPTKAYGFVGVVTSLKDLSSSIWVWHREGGNGGTGAGAGANGGNGAWAVQKVIEIPAEPANPDDLPPLLKGFGAVPPLVTDINLSLDDRFLYVSCWGTGEFRQYDVSDPFKPALAGSVRLGGIVGRSAHPVTPSKALNGGPQMVEVSRDGRRVYFTNSLYASWDAQFYPDGVRGWMAKIDVPPEGGMQLDPRFFLEFDALRPHQVHLEGGDSSSDSYCFSLRGARRTPVEHATVVSLAMLAGLGAFHGVNPGMGWLFAVALGMQEGSRRAVWRALLPLGLGHVLAIAVVIAGARLLGLFTPAGWLPLAAGLALIALGAARLFRHRHPRWGGMRVGLAGLTMWSFVMASAHGAGLMALPLVLPSAAVAAAPHAHAHAAMGGSAASAPGLLAATLAHGAGYLLVTALLAVIVYEKLGLGLLRRAWINVDLIWAVALLITGALTLATA